MTRTTITTPATLPGDGPRRRCPSCETGWIMADGKLAWEGTCNRCGHEEHEAEDVAGSLAELRDNLPRQCSDCPEMFTPRNSRQQRCTPCASKRHLGQINAGRQKRRAATAAERAARQERERVASRERMRRLRAARAQGEVA